MVGIGTPKHGSIALLPGIRRYRTWRCHTCHVIRQVSKCEGYPHSNNQIKHQLVNLIQDATPDAIISLMCPACHGGLSVQYTSKGKTALSVTCAQCMWRVISDGLRTEPPWVRELGPKVQTAKNKVVEIAITGE